MDNLLNKKILLIICGGIAAYKSLEIIRSLKKKGVKIKTILTKSTSAVQHLRGTVYRDSANAFQ